MSLSIREMQTRRGTRYKAIVKKLHRGKLQAATRTFDSKTEAQPWGKWQFAQMLKNIDTQPQTAAVVECDGFKYAMHIMTQHAAQRRAQGGIYANR